MSRANVMFKKNFSHEVNILSRKMSFCDFLFNISFSISNFCVFCQFFCDSGKSLPLRMENLHVWILLCELPLNKQKISMHKDVQRTELQ